MQVSHSQAAVAVSFDEPNLVSAAGLLPVMRLAEAAGLRALTDAHLSVPTDKGRERGPEDRLAGGRDGRRGGLDR